MGGAVVDAIAVDVDRGGAGEVGQEGGQVTGLEPAESVDRRRLEHVVVGARCHGNDRLRVTAHCNALDVDRRHVLVLDQQRAGVVVVVVVVVVVDAKTVDVQLQRRRLG